MQLKLHVIWDNSHFPNADLSQMKKHIGLKVHLIRIFGWQKFKGTFMDLQLRNSCKVIGFVGMKV